MGEENRPYRNLSFVDFWFRSVHTEIINRLGQIDSQVHVGNSTWKIQAKMLKQELDNEEKEGLRELASNAFLMTFICEVAFKSEEMSLPTQRILLYSQTVNSMILKWNNKESSINASKLVWILGDIAEYIHGTSSSGLIEEDVLKERCSSSIRSYENIKEPSENDLKRYDEEATKFVQIIRDDVGILAARGESLYGFLHLTFQEYFASLSLVNKTKLKRKLNSEYMGDARSIAWSLHQHINDPRFRMVISLALGKLSLPQAKSLFDEVCSAFLKESQTSSSLFPLESLFLVSCRNDLSCLPSSQILFEALSQLLHAAHKNHWYFRHPKLFAQLTDCLKKLPNATVIEWIHHILSHSKNEENKPIRALCHLIQCEEGGGVKTDWLNPSICRSLLELSREKDKITDFVLDILLAKIAFKMSDMFPTSSDSLKYFLQEKEIEIANIHPSVLALLIMLHGGLKRDGNAIVFDPTCIYRDSSPLTCLLINYFSDYKTSHVDKLQSIEEECDRILLRIVPHDEPSIAVDSLTAIICLWGIEKLWKYPHLLRSRALLLTLHRLKHASLFLRQCYSDSNCEDAQQILSYYMKRNDLVDSDCVNDSGSKNFFKMVKIIATASARLRSECTFSLPSILSTEESLQDLLSADILLSANHKSSFQLPDFVNLFWILEDDEETDTQYRMAVAADTIPTLLLYNNDKNPLYALAFVSENVRLLFRQLLQQKDIFIHNNQMSCHTLPFQHILIECLMNLSNSSCKRLSLTFALCALLPLLRVYNLENFAASLSWTLSKQDNDYLIMFEYTRQRPLNTDTGQYTDDFTGLLNAPIDFVPPLLNKTISCGLKQEQTRDAPVRSDWVPVGLGTGPTGYPVRLSTGPTGYPVPTG